MKLVKVIFTVAVAAALSLPACTSTGFSVKEYKPNNRQLNVEYIPEFPLEGSEEKRLYVGLVKMTIVNYTEYHLTVRYVGEPGQGAGKRFRRGNTLLLNTGKKKLRLRAIRSLNKQKTLADGRIEEMNQYRLTWGGLGTIGRAEQISVAYHGRRARLKGLNFTENDFENFRRFIKTYSQKHVRL